MILRFLYHIFYHKGHEEHEEKTIF